MSFEWLNRTRHQPPSESALSHTNRFPLPGLNGHDATLVMLESKCFVPLTKEACGGCTDRKIQSCLTIRKCTRVWSIMPETTYQCLSYSDVHRPVVVLSDHKCKPDRGLMHKFLLEAFRSAVFLCSSRV